jgi:predicted AlkP superfamily pyrophosphatase or phosphodiesterase
MRLLFSLVLLCATLPGAAKRPLLIVSIDGMDHRYLRDRDPLGLKIPNLRRMIAEGAWADGVVGVVPTVTFPSHTTLVTGVRPDQHGILNNNLPKDQGGTRYFSAKYLKVPTLWDAARKAGLKTAAVHWPVTVDAAIDWNLPEVFERRRGGGMDFASMAAKSTPGLIEKITAKYPSFPLDWVDDRVRTLGTLYLLKHEKPDVIFLHLVDHDSEAHETGPFSGPAKAMLEYQDELLGQMIAAAPKNMVFAVVSDHGFERVDRLVNIPALLKKAGVAGKVDGGGTLITTQDAAVAAALREAAVGREIPRAEWKRLLPHQPFPAAAFEPKLHEQFSLDGTPVDIKPERGTHGYWPLRSGYRASFLLWGSGVKKERLPELDMLSLASRFAAILEITF